MSQRITIVSRLFRPEAGAAAYRLGALADELVAQGYRVRVLTTVPPEGARIDDAGLDVRRWPVLRDKGGNVRGYVQYLSYDIPLFFRLLFTKSDAVVVEPPTTTGVVSRIVCALTRTPYFHYSADVVSTAAEGIGVNRTVVRVLKLLERWVLNGARHTIAVSDGVKKDLLSLGVPEDRITVVGVGIDTTRFDFAPNDEQVPAKKLVYGGTMSEIHGAEIFVRAFSKVADKHPDATLLMIGQGVDVPMLKDLAADLAPGQVEFRPPQSAEHLSDEFATASAALASVKPGVGYDFAFATKALSSLSAGAPVIYTGVGPMASIIRDNDLGWTVEWDDTAVSEAMDKALTDHPDTARRVALSRWVEHHHSLQTVAAHTVDVFNQEQ
ncbi:glycosyltransferase involved in cell wall biosynthesis [Halopolyspora algeriensis]|uniref:Glycosyltransferase involved in cell wall biosynthesis n=1 Tax=Halopolyspora algeriensis TaxID=1500506 RepID=A0A368VBK5_9ACTN|nr:glycosyltransferase family 4 protein [Halopolyspora algeriensis]RCW38502.1 glycosyltransferase involved in cell wall biosynthesis [Halopolyspora algeriensis]TQM42583.1 glycosyltransferase involved in cell wall biosynthesis [Halopolyspora algeriensis]